MSTDTTTLSPAEAGHYSRQTMLPELGMAGQLALKRARVLMIGAGGLGSPVGLYLAAAGVGTLGIVEFDQVDASNLHRQVLYGTHQLGQPKLDSAIARLSALNPHITIVPHAVRLTADNALDVLGGYDIVVDGTDNFAARYLINDASVMLNIRVVHASIFRFDGMLSVFGAEGGPCYRCLFPEPPPPGLLPSCAEAGVLGVLPGIVGALQANEVIKLITGIGQPLIGTMLQIDALGAEFTRLDVAADPDCPCCGAAGPSALVDYHELCGITPPAAVDSLISSAALAAHLAAGKPCVLLDVRGAAEHALQHIAGDYLIPLDELGDRLDELDKETLVICYCLSGMRSARAVRQLRAAGFDGALSLDGGIQAWLAAAPSTAIPADEAAGLVCATL
jgi:molybdopterin/thiamine biosynthesis adenylyltransferase/rhodanese-related sulfurtransferase